jgi:NADPH-dependent 2,4-dienoyl-CoA reductase/sulfur reductase-like enzyme
VLATGVEPNSELAARAGIATGISGAIEVDRGMRTSVPRVFAAGDCVETHHAVLDRPAYLPLGTTAHKQGRVAGTNAAGGDARFAGSVGTQVVKVFDLAAARTGLSEEEARTAGFDATTARVVVPDHKPYYPGARDLHIGLIADPGGRLLGAEIVGDWRAGVAKRIDILATAVQHAWPVSALLDLDLSYTPPLGSPWDAVQLAADAWLRSSRARARVA